MILVAIAWTYVALLMAVAEASHADGTVLGAAFTFVLYGLAPLSLVLYVMGTPARRKARRAAEAACDAGSSAEPDAGGQATASAQPRLVPPVREEP